MRFNVMIGIFCVCLLMFSSKVAASEKYSEITDNYQLQQVLTLLQNHNADTRETLEIIEGKNLTQKPINIMFFNLSQINTAYANYDALACKHRNGSLYILINKIHKNAPLEALASLLSHEVLHQDDENSYQEETMAWTREAKTWISFKKADKDLYNPKLNEYPLVTRLNLIEKMYVKASYSTGEISKEVHSNVGYRGLAEYSPGYGL